MAPFTKFIVVCGFSVVSHSFSSSQLLGAATKTQAGQLGLAAAAFFPAVLATLVLTHLLLSAHMREAGARPRLVAVLAMVTLLAATVALLAGAVVQLGADGHLDRGRDDVARLNIK